MNKTYLIRFTPGHGNDNGFIVTVHLTRDEAIVASKIIDRKLWYGEIELLTCVDGVLIQTEELA